jgi:threonine 3-dehydrogenase
LSLNVSRDLIAPERAVLGSEYFCYDELRSNLKILHDNLPYLGQIITHRFAVQDIREAFEIFFHGETGKVLVEH